MVIRLQLLLSLVVLCVGAVVAQVPSDLKFTLHHELLHSESSIDVSPSGIISYDKSQNTASLTEQSELVDFASRKGIYRIGVYDSNKKQLGPAGFTKLVFPQKGSQIDFRTMSMDQSRRKLRCISPQKMSCTTYHTS